MSTIAAPVVARIFDTGVRAGVPAAELAALLKRSRDELVDGARVPMPPMYACFAHCMRTTRDPAFPLQVAQAVTLEDYAVIGFALMTSTSATEAFSRLARYGHLVSDSGAWRIRVDEDGVELLWVRAGKRSLGHRVANECAIAELVGGMRRGFGAGLAPTQVFFRHARPERTREHEAFFRAPIQWGAPREGIVLPKAVLALPPKTGNAAMSRFFGEDLARRGDARQRFSERVRRALAERLASGPPGAAWLAANLGMGERSLRRALAEEGTNLRALLDDLRRDAAREMLDARKSVTEIALLLGFSETSALSRAFRRWYGKSARDLVSRRDTRSTAAAT